MRPFYKWIPFVRQERCDGCGLCGAMCARDCLDVADGISVLVDPEACTSEGACVSVCPQRAIHMSWMPLHAGHSAGRWRSASSLSRRAAASAAATGK